MKLEELYDEICKDFVIDETDLIGESVKSPKLFCKYIKLYSDNKMRLELLENKRKDLISKRREYYSGNASAEVYKAKPFNNIIKSEVVMQKYLDNDEEVVKYDENLIIQREKVKILESCMKEINNRNYQIKNIVDMTKFLGGA